MKEHILIIFLTLTTCISIFIFTLVQTHEPMPVFDSEDILFEHQTIHGDIVISTNLYEELVLSFIHRNIGRTENLGHTTAVVDSEATHLILRATDTIPYTTHALVSSNPDLYKMIVIEAGTSIAHQAHRKKTTCDNTAVFMVSSIDLTGNEALIIGLSSDNEIILEIETP